MKRIQAAYDGILGEMVRDSQGSTACSSLEDITRRRVIHSLPEGAFSPEKMADSLRQYCDHLSLRPVLVLVDGYGWDEKGYKLLEQLPAYKKIVTALGASLWFSVRAIRESLAKPGELPVPVQPYRANLDVAVFLDPAGAEVEVHLLKDFDRPVPRRKPLHMAATFTGPLVSKDAPSPDQTPPPDFTLLSGAAEGAEAEFGAAAERWGVMEKNFSFAGRPVTRHRGLVLLADEDLRQGDVSWVYLKTRMQRSYRDTDDFRKVLQSIWHQVAPAQEVFAVGTIQDNGTVKGGTGWAVELAKHLRKPVFVYDQGQKTWFSWNREGWARVPDPVIRHRRFAGTGTRSLTEQGKQAIEELFQRSFG